MLDANGTAHFVLGNENLNKASKARIPGQAVHVSLFSLPNQPNRADKTLRALLEEAGIAPGRRIGITGWKHFTSPVENNEKLFDIPAFILDAIRAVTGGDETCSTPVTCSWRRRCTHHQQCQRDRALRVWCRTGFGRCAGCHGSVGPRRSRNGAGRTAQPVRASTTASLPLPPAARALSRAICSPLRTRSK